MLQIVLIVLNYFEYSVINGIIVAVIGKGGENIAMIQSETGVKVQFAQGKSSVAVFNILKPNLQVFKKLKEF